MKKDELKKVLNHMGFTLIEQTYYNDNGNIIVDVVSESGTLAEIYVLYDCSYATLTFLSAHAVNEPEDITSWFSAYKS